MPETFIYKPGTYKGPVVLVPSEGSREPPVITTSDGKRFVGQYLNTNEGRHQFVFPRELYQYSDLNVTYGGQSGTIGSGAISYEGNSIGNWQAREKGSLGSAGGGGAGNFPGSLAPFDFGAGASPGYLGGQFPFFQPIDYQPTEYDPIDVPDYTLIDPDSFASEYAPTVRREIGRNFGLGREMALETLETELAGLRGFAPAAAALKRSQLTIDNLFNQAQRTAQIDRALPGTREALAAQTTRARVLGTGRLPDEIQDRSLELAVRSEAADLSRTRGFGDDSVVGRKASDLMSARERFQLSQAGDALLQSNIATRSQFELAPTSFSDAGQQIRVTPEVGAGRLTQAFTTEANQLGVIPATQAFTQSIQQQQFKTNLNLDVSKFNAGNTLQNAQFNASNTLQKDQFNASNVYASQLGFFNYNQGFASNLAGLQTAQINQTREDAIRDKLTAAFKDSLSKGQDRNTIKDILGTIGKIPGLVDTAREIFDSLFPESAGDPLGSIDSGDIDFEIGGEPPAFDIDPGAGDDFTATGPPPDFSEAYLEELGIGLDGVVFGVDLNQLATDLNF